MKHLVLLLLCLSGWGAELPVIDEHEVFSQTFTITNSHERAIRFTTIDATCTCSTLEVADRFLLPGASTTLSMVTSNHNTSGVVKRTVWLYCSDPEYEPIEVQASWEVRPAVFVDLIPPESTSVDDRPAERAWRDIYRYTADVRPTELDRLRKVIRIGSPPGTRPAEGLQITGIDYGGDLWRFDTRQLDDGHWLLIARAAERQSPPEERLYTEPVTVRTNHPGKPEVQLEFLTHVSVDAGSGRDPFADMR